VPGDDRGRANEPLFGFIDWNVISRLHPEGILLLVQLTLVAMIGGIALGTASR
jgi:hypothetical protein